MSIPEDLHWELKKAVVEDKTTVGQFVTDAIQEKLERKGLIVAQQLEEEK